MGFNLLMDYKKDCIEEELKELREKRIQEEKNKKSSFKSNN